MYFKLFIHLLKIYGLFHSDDAKLLSMDLFLGQEEYWSELWVLGVLFQYNKPIWHPKSLGLPLLVLDIYELWYNASCFTKNPIIFNFKNFSKINILEKWKPKYFKVNLTENFSR